MLITVNYTMSVTYEVNDYIIDDDGNELQIDVLEAIKVAENLTPIISVEGDGEPAYVEDYETVVVDVKEFSGNN
jgi:hypothetical protein